MRTACKLGMLLVFVAALACAETWSGKLYDAKCTSQHETKDWSACVPTESSTMFALQVSDKLYKFDAEGNKKAAEAYKKSRSGAERAEDPAGPPSKGSLDMGKEQREVITAAVQGTLVGDVIRIDTIDVQ